LILRKILKITASRCHILRLKCTKFDFEPQLTPLGELTALPKTPYLLDLGPTSKERGGRGEEGMGGKEKEVEEDGKGGP